MLKGAIAWRVTQRPDLMSSIKTSDGIISPEQLKIEAATGKVRHGRINGAIDVHGTVENCVFVECKCLRARVSV